MANLRKNVHPTGRVARPVMRRVAVAAALALSIPAVLTAAVAAETIRIVTTQGAQYLGTLKSFEDGAYIITTPSGDVKIEVGNVATLEPVGEPKPETTSNAPLPASTATATMNSAVTLILRDTSRLVGRVVAFEDGYYEFQTATGVQRVAAANVSRIEPTSESAIEPVPRALTTALTGGSVSLSSSRALGETVIKYLVETYASEGGATSPMWTQRGGPDERTFLANVPMDRKFVANVSLKGTRSAIDDLANGTAEVALLERPMTSDETQQVAKTGLGDPALPQRAFEIAPSAVLVVVHPSNPVKKLTLTQIADIFSGRTRNWSDVGGTNRRIQVVAPADGSGLIDIAQAKFPKPFNIGPTARRLASSLETADLVAADPAAIGLTEWEARGNTNPLTLVNDCGLVFEPTPFQIQSGSYPLTSRLVLYTTGKAAQPVRDFVAFVQSSRTQRGLADHGFASLTPRLAGKGEIKYDGVDSARVPDASAQFNAIVSRFVSSAAPTSITIRFGPDGSKLDAQAIDDIDRLVEFVKSGGLGQRTLVLIGYSDNTGAFAADVKQSKSRALFAAEVLRQKGLAIDKLFGFGPLLPVDCDATALGAARNRRVEVWVE